MTSVCPPIAPGPILREQRPAGSPGWVPKGYNRADALVRCVVSRSPEAATGAIKTSDIHPPGYDSRLRKMGSEKRLVFSSDFENVGKTLIAGIPPSGAWREALASLSDSSLTSS